MERIDNLINSEYSNITGLVVLNNGDMEYEQYFNGYNQNDTIHSASVTKETIKEVVDLIE